MKNKIEEYKNDIVKFSEEVLCISLNESQKRFLREIQSGKRYIVSTGLRGGMKDARLREKISYFWFKETV